MTGQVEGPDSCMACTSQSAAGNVLAQYKANAACDFVEVAKFRVVVPVVCRCVVAGLPGPILHQITPSPDSGVTHVGAAGRLANESACPRNSMCSEH